MMTRVKLVAAGLSLVPFLAFAQLTVNELTGFGAGGTGPVNLAITSSTNDYNICTAVQSTGVNPATTPSGVVTITISNSVIVGSTSSSTPAMQTGDCGSSWQSGWTVTIVVAGTDSARIEGRGGDGGTAGCTVAFSSIGAGGGGGGGAGTQGGSGGIGGSEVCGFTPVGSEAGTDGTATTGGSGGTHRNGSESGMFAFNPGDGDDGGDALEATDGGPDISLAPESGATLEVWGGGGGGGGGTQGIPASDGGAGGNYGQNGTAGSGGAPGSGGSNGLAYSEPGSASVVEVGPGTIDAVGS